MTIDHVTVNRSHWELWAAAHGQDTYYDSTALIDGADSLTDVEWAGSHR